MPAWILNTKALNGASSGRGSPSASSRGPGAGASSSSTSSSCRTPKLSTAEPNSTGVVWPARNASWSCTCPIASSSSDSSTAVVQASPSSAAARSGSTRSSGATVAPPAVRVKRMKSPDERSRTPRKSPAMPTGQVSGVGSRPVRSRISSMSCRASRPGRSHLLTTVITGIPRCRQTSNSFIVCGSSPLAASSSITALSTAASTR